MQRSPKSICQRFAIGHMDDNKLLREALKGKPEAQHELYHRFAPVMLGICFRYTKSVADAEDVLQEGFVKVFKHLHQFKGDGQLGAWIRRIMVNSALNFLKTNKKYQHDLIYNDVVLHPVSLEDPVIQIEAKELAALIRQLPTGYQTIFNLHAVEGYSHVEIGEMLGIADGTSRSQYARARALLIDWLKKISLSEQKERYGK